MTAVWVGLGVAWVGWSVSLGLLFAQVRARRRAALALVVERAARHQAENRGDQWRAIAQAMMPGARPPLRVVPRGRPQPG